MCCVYERVSIMSALTIWVHDAAHNSNVVLLKSGHKSSHAPSMRNLVLDKKSMGDLTDFSWLGCFMFPFEIVGWVIEQQLGHKNPRHLWPKILLWTGMLINRTPHSRVLIGHPGTRFGPSTRAPLWCTCKVGALLNPMTSAFSRLPGRFASDSGVRLLLIIITLSIGGDTQTNRSISIS